MKAAEGGCEFQLVGRVWGSPQTRVAARDVRCYYVPAFTCA
jgi:hypothetical protein